VRRDDLNKVCGVSDMGGWWASRLAHRAQIPTLAQWSTIRAAFSPPESFDAGVFAASWSEPNGDCRDFAVGREAKPDHPSPKPLAPTEWFLSRLGARWVLDCFAGSGTTLLAAKNMHIPSVGIEIEERYCDVIAQRLSQSVLDFGAA
jgi:hypothetical protein